MNPWSAQIPDNEKKKTKQEDQGREKRKRGRILEYNCYFKPSRIFRNILLTPVVRRETSEYRRLDHRGVDNLFNFSSTRKPNAIQNKCEKDEIPTRNKRQGVNL